MDGGTGVERGAVGKPDDYVESELSPDGTQVAVEINERNGLSEIWVLNAERGTRTPITPTAHAWEYGPRWSPDGRYVAFSAPATRRDGGTIRRKLADGSGADEIVANVTGGALWNRDGKELYYLALDGTIMAVAVSGTTVFRAEDPQPLFKIRPSRDDIRQAFSTVDGRRFLVRSPDESTRPAIV